MTEQEKQKRIAALKKLFLSDEYLDEAVEYARLCALYSNKCVKSFKQNGPPDWEDTCPPYEGPSIWVERIIPYFEGNYHSLKKNVDLYKQGKEHYLSSCVLSSFSYAKMMDGVGWGWWEYIDKEIRTTQTQYENQKQNHCSNIYYTLDGWREGSILKEHITGPIDEEQLARYYE